jgi:cysteine desulfurase
LKGEIHVNGKIYFDNAATKPVRPEVFEAMKPLLLDEYGNPSSIYQPARSAKKLLDRSREQIAGAIGSLTEEVFFTSGATEANNWALRGVIESCAAGKHIITTAIEHHAVLHTCEYLQKSHGCDITYLPVDSDGLIDTDALMRAIRPDTALISVMFVNNEIGVVQPINEIGEIARARGILFHTDAVQALGYEHIDVNEQNIDLMSLSAHKIHGPKGVGALYIRKGTKLPPFIIGGGQENGRRAGTENMPGIVGFGKAAELISAEREEANLHMKKLQNKIIDSVLKIPNTRLNGSRDKRVSGNINVCFEFIEGESLLLLLDMKGIYASSGSACTSGSLDPSHVLLAIGLSHEIAHGSLRISLSKYSTEAEADVLLDELPAIVERLREMSPLYTKNKE